MSDSIVHCDYCLDTYCDNCTNFSSCLDCGNLFCEYCLEQIMDCDVCGTKIERVA